MGDKPSDESSDRETVRQRLYSDYVSANKSLPTLGVRKGVDLKSRTSRYYRHQLKEWLHDLPRNSEIVDLGCGAGFIMDVLAGMGFLKISGVDTSPEQVALARERHPEVVLGDIFSFLAESGRRFDGLVCFDVIEHLTLAEAIKFLDLCRQSLKPGGRLILQTPNGDAPLVGSVFNGDLTHETLFTPHSIRHLLLTCGFEQIVFQEHKPLPLDLKSACRAVAWKCLRSLYAAMHLIETGSTPSGVYSRVFRIAARRP